MARYIDADAFWNRLQQVVYDIFTYPADGEQYAHVGYYTETIQEVLKQTKTIEARPAVRGIEEWHEDYGDVLWWKFPIEEPPYVGSPLDCNWSGCHTHWTPIEVPEPPNSGADMRGEEDG